MAVPARKYMPRQRLSCGTVRALPAAAATVARWQRVRLAQKRRYVVALASNVRRAGDARVVLKCARLAGYGSARRRGVSACPK